MTLVEVLATAVLLLILSTALFYILTAAKTHWMSGMARSALREDVQSALWRMGDDLRNSEAALLTDGTASTPVAFSFPSAYDAQGRFVTDPTGGLVWQRFVIYYIPTGTKRLVRRDVYSLPTTPPIQLTQAGMVAYCNGSGLLVADNVTGLSLVVDPDSGAVTLNLTLQKDRDRFSASQIIVTRN